MSKDNFKTDFQLSEDDVKTNARIRLLPDESGKYKPYEILVFPKKTFLKGNFECIASERKNGKATQLELELCDELPDEIRSAENRRKSYCRARNKLFDLLMCTTEFDCFVTLTLSSGQIDRKDYSVVIKKLNVWFANRVVRNGLVYAFVPELHKDGAIHFHGLCNFSALKTVRATNAHTGKPLCDNKGREVYNITDFPYGFTTAIPLSGKNARVATAKYCYKYITKSGGEKVGGRYYLSGGKLGRPRYEFIDLPYEQIPCKESSINDTIIFKKWRVDENASQDWIVHNEKSDALRQKTADIRLSFKEIEKRLSDMHEGAQIRHFNNLRSVNED